MQQINLRAVAANSVVTMPINPLGGTGTPVMVQPHP